MCILLNHINANVIAEISDQDFINEWGEPYGLLKDVLTGRIDIAMNAYYIRGYWKAQSYPFYTEQLKIISLKDSPENSNASEYIFTVEAWFFIIICSVAYITVLKFILEQPASLAALEFMRILSSSSTLKEPRTLPRRISLITLVIASWVINKFLLSCLSAMTTVENCGPIIDSAEDLMNSSLSIYGTKGYADIIWQEEIRYSYEEIGTFKECADRLLEGENIACIEENGFLRYYLYENATVHISKDDLVSRPYAYVFSEDSPLRHKLTMILLKMGEGGIIDLINNHDHMYFLKDLDNSVAFEASDMEYSKTSFVILIGGWTLGIIVLVIEIAIYRIKNISNEILKMLGF